MLPGRTPTHCGERSSCAATLNWSISTCALPRFRCVMRSETENTPNMTNEKIVPATVALGLVNKFTIAIKNNTSVINASPNGISLPKKWKFNGTRYSRSPGCVYRITRTAMPCMVKLQITPRSEEHTSELQSQSNLVCRLLLAKKKTHKIRVLYRFISTFYRFTAAPSHASCHIPDERNPYHKSSVQSQSHHVRRHLLRKRKWLK